MTFDDFSDIGFPARQTRVRITIRSKRPSWRRSLPSDPREQMRKAGRAAALLQKARAL